MTTPESTEKSGISHLPGGSTVERVAHLRQWVGKSERSCARILGQQVAALAASLDRQGPPRDGDILPPLWHWIFFHAPVRHSELGIDGHPHRGVFLPPVSLPRRMWAGSQLQFGGTRPLRVGETAVRRSIIKSVEYKHGRSGDLVFVTVSHTISNDDGEVVVTEEQDIVYRQIAAFVSGGGGRAPSDPAWFREIRPDAALLFRYSALTFNSHRIHYDRPYATEVEGYPGLVVQGPLIATLLVELLQVHMPAVRIKSFSFRAVAPLFDVAPFLICGSPHADRRSIALWAQTLEGALAMSATADLF